MIYGGSFFIWGSLKGEQLFSFTRTDDDDPTDTLSQQRILNLNSKGKMIGVNFAYEFLFNKRWSAAAEFSTGKMTWQNNNKSISALNLGLGYHF